MERVASPTREVAEDVYFGQIVIIWARWFVILAAAVLALWSSDDTSELGKRALLVVVLMGVNFFLHGRSISGRPANMTLLLATSLIDIAVVGAMVAFWSGGGIESELYVLYYPLVFAFALVFPQRITAVYGLLAVGSYAAICILSDTGLLTNSVDAKALAMRVITLAATAALGTYYWRIQRRRRRLAGGAIPAHQAH
jgi:hypothetical protein